MSMAGTVNQVSASVESWYEPAPLVVVQSETCRILVSAKVGSWPVNDGLLRFKYLWADRWCPAVAARPKAAGPGVTE